MRIKRGCGPADLDDGFAHRKLTIEAGGRADDAFAPDHCAFDCLARRELDDERNDAAVKEIHVVDRGPSLVQHQPLWDIDGSQMWAQGRELGSRERRQK